MTVRALLTRRGVTMAEAVVVMFMLSVCLAIVAAQYTDASRALGREESADTAVRTIRLCLDMLANDIEQASFASLAPRGGLAHELSLQRVDPDRALRVVPLPQPVGLPLLPPRLVTVRWRLDAAVGRLRREGAKAATLVGHRVVDFGVQVYEPDAAEGIDPGRVACYVVVDAGDGRKTSVSTMLRARVRDLPAGATAP